MKLTSVENLSSILIYAKKYKIGFVKVRGIGNYMKNVCAHFDLYS